MEKIPSEILSLILKMVAYLSEASIPVLCIVNHRWNKCFQYKKLPNISLKWYFKYAAYEGNIKLMRFYRRWIGVWNNELYNVAICDAARGGQLEVMNQLKKWGATVFHNALCTAACFGHINCMKQLKEWVSSKDRYKVENLDIILLSAAAGDHVKGILLLKEWGAKDRENYILYTAAECGSLKVLKYLKECGETDFINPIHIAAENCRFECFDIMLTWCDISINEIISETTGNTKSNILWHLMKKKT